MAQQTAIKHPASSTGRFWLLWTAVTLIGGIVAILLSLNLLGMVASRPTRVAFYALMGGGLGGLQALVLRGRYPQPWWWVLTSAGGWALGFTVIETNLLFLGWIDLSGAALGLALGILQWLVLSWHVRRAGWWVLASTLGWGLGWIAGWSFELTELLPVSETVDLALFVLRLALIPALVTGWAMARLLAGDQPAQPPPAA